MIKFPKKYIMELDEQVKSMIRNGIVQKGIETYISDEFVRLDCSRVLDNMRMMQTIGTPYKYENAHVLYGIDYALEEGLIDENKRDEFESKLVALHKRNLKYEEDNPPIIYDKKKGLKKTTRTTRRKAKEGTIEGFEKPKKEKAPTAAQLNAQARAKLISKLKINL